MREILHNFPPAQLLQCNGIDLEVFESGRGQPLVLCHGWPEHAYSWRHQVQPLVEAGYHVIVPNQRGFGNSSCPAAVEAYNIQNLCADLCSLLDHYGYEDALFVGHDWGAIVTWNMALLQPQRVTGLINFSVPLMVRGKKDWISFWEEQLGPDFYMVHFNRQPGVADAVFDANAEQFLRNMYRTEHWREKPVDLGEGMPLVNLALAGPLPGTPIMSDAELQVFLDAFKHTGFTPSINWYRNFRRNWEILEHAPTQVHCPVLMIYAEHDMVPQFPGLNKFVPHLETATLQCGHWIMQEKPEQSTALMLAWLQRHGANPEHTAAPND